MNIIRMRLFTQTDHNSGRFPRKWSIIIAPKINFYVLYCMSLVNNKYI